MRLAIIFGVIVVAGGLTYALWPSANNQDNAASNETLADGALVNVVMPVSLSPNAEIGKRAFEAKCAACHGTDAVGQDGVAPPLVHIIYEPSHHGDESFQRAASVGVKSHHWRFGNMPPVDGLTLGDVSMIVTYIRELQRANGIN